MTRTMRVRPILSQNVVYEFSAYMASQHRVRWRRTLQAGGSGAGFQTCVVPDLPAPCPPRGAFPRQCACAQTQQNNQEHTSWLWQRHVNPELIHPSQRQQIPLAVKLKLGPELRLMSLLSIVRLHPSIPRPDVLCFAASCHDRHNEALLRTRDRCCLRTLVEAPLQRHPCSAAHCLSLHQTMPLLEWGALGGVSPRGLLSRQMSDNMAQVRSLC